MKGQGSTEYLVIFAAVLVVALIVILLLGQFAGFAQKASLDQSKDYWNGALPISLQDWSATGDNLTVIFQNRDLRRIIVTNMTLDGTAPSSFSEVVLAGGESSEQTITYPSGTICGSGDSGKTKEFNVVIKYKYRSSGSEYIEVGKTPLRLVCP